MNFSSSLQNHHHYHHPYIAPQPYKPPQFQPYNHPHHQQQNYPSHNHLPHYPQQQNFTQYHHQPPPNNNLYQNNTYPQQPHVGPWHPQQQHLVHHPQPGHVQLPRHHHQLQQHYQHVPQIPGRVDPAAVVVALAQLLAPPQQPQRQQWYPQPGTGGAGPSVGPGQFQSQRLSNAGQSLDRSGGRVKGHSKKKPAVGVWCELCKVHCPDMAALVRHNGGKKHRRKEKKVDAELKSNDAELADSPEDANQDLVVKKPTVSPLENQSGGVKRKMVVSEGKKKKGPKAKKQVIFIPTNDGTTLMCYLCKVTCGSRENLSRHLLGREHTSMVQNSENPGIYRRLGLQALYPRNPSTQSVSHAQGVQQVSNGEQVSDRIAAPSVLPSTDNDGPSIIDVSSDSLKSPDPKIPIIILD